MTRSLWLTGVFPVQGVARVLDGEARVSARRELQTNSVTVVIGISALARPDSVGQFAVERVGFVRRQLPQLQSLSTSFES